MKNFYKLLAVMIVGFAGGAVSPMALGWLKSTANISPSDAVSIANTYIVFTTIIFVGFTVVLGIAGYVFTQQFSAQRQTLEHQVFEELRVHLAEDEQRGIQMLNALLENSDVKAHLQSLLEDKVNELVDEKLAETQGAADQAAHEADAVKTLAGELRKNGKGH